MDRILYQQIATAIFFRDLETIAESRWHQPWSEPVRLRRGLGRYLQHSLTIGTQPIPTPPFVFLGWWAPYRDPVRLRVGLSARLQQALSYPPRLLPPPNVTLVMDATEVNSDIAAFGVDVYNPLPPIVSLEGAKVAIEEVPVADRGSASLREI